MKMRKTMSLFLALAMSASMPFAALATETEPLDPLMQVQTEGAAKIGEKSYNTLEDAIKNAENGNTIILVDNVANGASVEIPAEKNLKLDLNGKNYTISNVKAGTNYGFSVNKTGQSGTVTFTNGTIAAGAGVVSLIENSANVRLSNVKLSANGSKALLNKADATASIEDANVIVDGNIENAGTLTIKGGNFNGDVANSGTLTVEKGKFTKNITGNGRLSISGGNFDGNIDASNGEISGGAFSIKPDDKFLTPNMKFEMLDPNSGKYVVSEKKAEDGNTPLAPPATVEKAENYIRVNADAALENALKGIGLNIDNADLVKNVKSLTKNDALKLYKEKDPTFNDADVAKLSISADVYVDVKGNVISTASGKESFSVGITPTVTTYVENEKKEKVPVKEKSPFTAVTSAGVTIPVPDQFASVKEFTVTQNGTPVAATMSGKNIVLSGIKDFSAPFTITAKAAADDTYLTFPKTANVKVNAENKLGNGPIEAAMVEKIKATSFAPNTFAFKSEGLTPIKESKAREALGNVAGDITLSAEVTVDIQLTKRSDVQNKENFNLKFMPRYVIYANAGGKSAEVAMGEFTPTEQIKVTVPLHDSFAKLKAQNRKLTVNDRADESTSNSSVAFTTSSLRGDFMIAASKGEDKPTPTPPPAGYDEQITVLDGTYKIKDKKLIKTDSNNTIKFDESAYLVVVKGGYNPSTNANNVEPEYFLTKDDVSKLRIGTVRFEENGKLVDGKVSWQARMIKVDGKNKGVYLIEIPIKKNSGYTSSKDVFGNFELRASKPYYFGNDETRENVNFYVEIDADVNTDTDEIYDGTHVYEFNDTEDDEITLYGGDGTFIVDTRGQGKLLIRTDVKYNEGIEKVNPNANYVYYNSNYPTFNRLGYLYLKANKGDKIYKVDRDTGKLTKMPVPYDRDMEAFKIRTRTLGCYVVAEKELDLDRINGVIAPEPVKPPVAPPSIINPPTGSAI